MKKIKKIKAVYVLVLLAIVAGFSGCGILGSDSGDGKNPTFAQKDNYTRNDVLANDNDTKKDTTENISSTDNAEATISTTAESVEYTTKITEPTESPTTTESPEYEGPPPPPTDPTNPTNPTKPPKTPDREGTVRLSFLAAGDNIMHLNMINDAKERAKTGENFNFKDMYKDIESMVKSYDIALVNVETPIAGDEFPYSGYPMFNTPKENAFALMDMGFNVIATANNHMLDKGERGYKNSIDFWDAQNVLQIGSFKDAADFENVRILEKNGVTIAFLSYTYGTNGMTLPSGSKMVVPFYDYATVERQVKAARPLADLLFVVMHWGIENSFTPDSQQRSLAQMMVENNVDVIIGMHPHVLQETKWVDRPDGKKTLLTYSLGNMISGMLDAKNMVGAFLSFDIVKTTQNGVSDARIENAEMIPIVTQFKSSGSANFRGFQIYKFENYTEELANAHGNRVYYDCDKKLTYKYLKDLITQNIAPEFLSDFYKN